AGNATHQTVVKPQAGQIFSLASQARQPSAAMCAIQVATTRRQDTGAGSFTRKHSRWARAIFLLAAGLPRQTRCMYSIRTCGRLDRLRETSLSPGLLLGLSLITLCMPVGLSPSLEPI